MSNRISNSAKRKLEILHRAHALDGVSVNIKWCFALVQEPAMKFLLRHKYMTLCRIGDGGCKKVTLAKITNSGIEYMNKLAPVSQ